MLRGQLGVEAMIQGLAIERVLAAQIGIEGAADDLLVAFLDPRQAEQYRGLAPALDSLVSLELYEIP